MTVFWWFAIPLLIAMAVVTIVDIFRRKLGTKATAGWVLIALLLPVVGPIVYWVTRKPPPEAAEEAYLAEADRRRELQRQPTDRSGL
jgi:hypothetical protein